MGRPWKPPSRSRDAEQKRHSPRLDPSASQPFHLKAASNFRMKVELELAKRSANHWAPFWASWSLEPIPSILFLAPFAKSVAIGAIIMCTGLIHFLGLQSAWYVPSRHGSKSSQRSGLRRTPDQSPPAGWGTVLNPSVQHEIAAPALSRVRARSRRYVNRSFS